MGRPIERAVHDDQQDREQRNRNDAEDKSSNCHPLAAAAHSVGSADTKTTENDRQQYEDDAKKIKVRDEYEDNGDDADDPGSGADSIAGWRHDPVLRLRVIALRR